MGDQRPVPPPPTSRRRTVSRVSYRRRTFARPRPIATSKKAKSFTDYKAKNPSLRLPCTKYFRPEDVRAVLEKDPELLHMWKFTCGGLVSWKDDQAVLNASLFPPV